MSETMVETRAEVTQEEQEAPILFLHGVERHYRQGDATLNVLTGVELAIWPGQSVALVAPSGAGKSTLLHIAGLLEHPDHGEVYIDGRATAACPTTSAPAFAAMRSASSISRIICCRNSPRWRTCCCRR